ncbi:ATP synthase F1 subunit gamma [Candidatus Bipolaricaulota bacterium]|nr:ATP synthase F1 subunit gamma [Candidatus Bipolaricaulota bacterium]TFH11222.1 MAG: ATP synthase F1 subunit gamma [Candidatus Atribacteria bacterium]
MSQNVRAIKSRIGNIENIGQITKAMNAIAMTKVTRMKRRLAETRPYIRELTSFAQRLMGRLVADEEAHPFTVSNGSSVVGVMVLNADRGLCGRYKGELNRESEKLVGEHGSDGRLILGGEKARAYYARRDTQILGTYANVYDEPTEAIAHRIADDLIAMYVRGDVGRIDLLYMRFVSDLSQKLVVEPFLPISIDAAENDDLLDPEADVMLDYALRMMLRATLYAALIETKTCEDALRRQAMRAATDNADDLLKSLTRVYNKARQQAITREIADIIGGAEALRTE